MKITLTQTTTTLVIYFILNVITQNQKIITIQGLTSIVLVFDLNKIPVENINSTIQFLGMIENRVLLSETVVNLLQTSDNGLKRISIYNFQNGEDNVSINLMNNIQNETSSIVQIDEIIIQYHIIKQKNQFNILMRKNDIQNYILPFNLLSQKTVKLFVEESKVNVDTVKYQNQPFLDNFWSDYGSDLLLLQWLPYFSRCSYKTSSKIFLDDLIYPLISSDYNLAQINKTCEAKLSWFWGIQTSCPQKNIITRCILQQINVQNRTKEPWWKNTGNILYYFLKPDVGDAFIQSQISNNYLDNLSQNYYRSLVPLVYNPLFNVKYQYPNSFQLELKIANINNLDIEILEADLKASIDRECQVEQVGEVCLSVNVKYLSISDTFFTFTQPGLYYYLFFGIISICAVGIIKIILYLMKINLRFITICKLSLYPIIKGYFIGFCLSTAYILSLYYIAESTKYRSIVLDFDSIPISDKWSAYAGRVGITTFLSGYFLLNMGIDKTFKILTEQETKMALEDEKQQKKSQKSFGGSKYKDDEQEEDEQQDKQNFIINTMNSHRRYLLLSILVYIMVIVYLYYVKLNFSLVYKFLFVLFGYPLVHKLIISLYRHLFGKQLLYLSSVLISLEFLLDMDSVSRMMVYQSMLYYCVRVFSENLIVPGVEVLSEWISIKIYNYISIIESKQVSPSVIFRVLSLFKGVVWNVVNESIYEKSLFYTMLINLRFGVIVSRIFLFMLIMVSMQYNYICRDLHRTSEQLTNSYSILLILFPIQIIIMILSIRFFEKILGLKLIKCLEINKFKFNKRKVRWINDNLNQNKCLNQFYRELERFCFSSQLYIIVFVIVFAIYAILIGFKIVLEVNFVCFSDPSMLFILIIVWFTGSISSIVVNFMAIKCKLYQRKVNRTMISKLQNIESTLKTINYEQYLQTEAIKNYFLKHSKKIIMLNINKILDRDDFIENNNQILKKFNNYREQIKRKQLEERKIIQRNKEQKENTKCLLNDKKNKNMVIRFSGNDFQEFVRPIIYSWLYLAKQFTFLKNVIQHIREKHKKLCCQYCSTSLQLQVVEKKQFAEVVNEYRLLNVGRIFYQAHFTHYYELNQKFVTVCSECKQKKKHIQKKDLPLCKMQKYLVIKWLVMARSRLLHRQLERKKKGK